MNNDTHLRESKIHGQNKIIVTYIETPPRVAGGIIITKVYNIYIL